MASDELRILRSKKHHSVSHIFGPQNLTFQLQARAPHQPQHRVLRHNVVRELLATNARRHARRTNYAPPHVPFYHCLPRVLHTRRHPTHVHRHELVVSRQVHVQRGLITVLDLFLVSDITVYVGADVGADFNCYFLALLILDVCDYNGSSAVSSEVVCCDLAQAACASEALIPAELYMKQT
ncbi:hypothetical protein CFP56_030960 [Quercus suber]|uniref:Uncharacterized protein n=1 Tax=Quercus suber TaxID=58331 RepID=A0AAW0JMB7_QUESU